MYVYMIYFFSFKAFKKIDADKKKEELDKMKQKYGLSTPEVARWVVKGQHSDRTIHNKWHHSERAL